jgi:hypothetical protein
MGGDNMPIIYYVGVSEPAIEVKTPEELLEAIDLLHTQVMDNINEDSPLLPILEKCMKEIRDEIEK